MGVREYSIQPGDDFYRLAQRLGGTCDDFLQCNPNIDPLKLQIGQKIVLPELKSSLSGKEQFADISVHQGQEFAGDNLDEVEMEVEGIRFRVRRIGETRIPHEIHLLLPRTEIRKVQPAGEAGPCEVQIMLSNVDIVHSPRLMSGKGDKAEGSPAGKGQQLQQGQQGQQPQQGQQVQQGQTTQPPQQSSQTSQNQQVQQMPQMQWGQQNMQSPQSPQGSQGPQMQMSSPSFGGTTMDQVQGVAPTPSTPRWRKWSPFKKS